PLSRRGTADGGPAGGRTRRQPRRRRTGAGRRRRAGHRRPGHRQHRTPMTLGQSWDPAASAEAELLAGTVTFLLTDIEGSTRLWEVAPEAMEVALERHNRLLTGVIEDHGGVVVTSRGEGDSFFAVFPGAVSAVEAAGACQLRLAREGWPAGAVLRGRMGLHTGEARGRGGGPGDHAPLNPRAP